MSRDQIVSAGWGLLAAGILAVLIVVGSRNLAHFDAVLVGYTFSILFATFGLAYRYSMWLRRPPTRMFWRGGWRSFVRRGMRGRNAGTVLKRFVTEVLGNAFIFRRDPVRGLTHFLIMWGCIIAVLITFPLVFGWLHFESVPGEASTYELIIFGFSTFDFPVHSTLGWLMFHGLVWASFLVIPGVMLAMRRRMRDRGAAATQRPQTDFTPLLLLFAVSATGLMLAASYTWMKGYAYNFLAILHAVTVIGTFLWLPFGKFFHIFQRPAQLGVGTYQDVGRAGEAAECRRCGDEFTSEMHVEDLIEVQRQLGFDYALEDEDLEHYQWICPPCRRASLGLAQGKMWEAARGGQRLEERAPGETPATPTHLNPAEGEGPLGEEDAENFHP